MGHPGPAEGGLVARCDRNSKDTTLASQFHATAVDAYTCILLAEVTALEKMGWYPEHA